MARISQLDKDRLTAEAAMLFNDLAVMSLPDLAAEVSVVQTQIQSLVVYVPPPPPIDITLVASVSPDTINQGQTTTITWTSKNATEVRLWGSPVALSGSMIVSPAATAMYSFKAMDSAGNMAVFAPIHVTVLPASAPIYPAPVGMPVFVSGEVPVDGFLGSVAGPAYRFRPKLTDGQRLSGTVTVSPPFGAPISVTYRFLVDGLPQPTNTIDTTQWPDGSHVLAFQIISASPPAGVSNGSRVVVFNNSGIPLASLDAQAVVASTWFGPTMNSLAWGRVNVLWPQATYPADAHLDLIVQAATDTDRTRLVGEAIWVVDGLNHQGTPLWQELTIVSKNKHGDVFVKAWNPEGLQSGVLSTYVPLAEYAPAYDGPRGIGNVSPLSVFSAAPQILASGQSGFLGVDYAGRVMRLDIITGEVRTIFGPRSKQGAIGTDPDDLTVTMAMRIARGEKEFVGDPGGGVLHQPNDIWNCPKFPDMECVVASTADNAVKELSFSMARLMRSWPVPGVTSVWASLELEDEGIAWYAVGPAGLYHMPVTPTPGTGNSCVVGRVGGCHGKVEQVAAIPKAFWVRGDKRRVYVMTLDLGIYEYSPDTRAVTELKPRESIAEIYAFMDVDVNGSCGPRGRIYWGTTASKGNSTRKNQIFYLDPDTKAVGIAFNQSRLYNNQVQGSRTAHIDSLGHYEWGITLHPTLPMFIACGRSSSSWFRWTAYLRTKPVLSPPISSVGATAFLNGKLDRYLGLSAITGWGGHGDIGYSCDRFSSYATYAEARGPMRTFLDPLFPSAMPESDREAVTLDLFMQSRHY